MNTMTIREYLGDTDFPGLRRCVVALQDHERGLDPRMPSGESIADPYIDEMLKNCESNAGSVYICEVDGEVAGYVTVQTRVTSGDIDDGNLEYGLVSDIIVLPEFQGQGFGRQLLNTAIDHARQNGVENLRIYVMARNSEAANLYHSLGFENLYHEMEMKF